MNKRRATTLIEFIIASSLLITIMTISGRLIYSTQKAWQSIRQERLANEELINQIDVLRNTPADSRSQEFHNPTPSPWIQSALDNPALRTEIINDELGERIRLTIQWGPGPLSHQSQRELVAWIKTPIATAIKPEVSE